MRLFDLTHYNRNTLKVRGISVFIATLTALHNVDMQ